MEPERFLRLVMLVLLAPTGLLVGHCVTHALAAPHMDAGASLLMDTGHVWWALAACAAAVVAVGTILILRESRSQGTNDPRPQRLERCAWLSSRLAVWQLGTFVVIDVVERQSMGHSASLVVHGALAQLVLAVVLTAAVCCLALMAERFCAAVASTRSWRHRVGPRPQAVGTLFVRPPLSLLRPVGSRAPPLPF